MLEKGWVKAALIGLGIDLILGILGMIPCVNCLLCPINLVAWFLIPIGVGVMAATWEGLHKTDLGGAASVVLKSGLLYAGVGMVLFIVLAIFRALLNSVFDLGATALWDSSDDLGNDTLSGPLEFFATSIGAVVCGGLGLILDLLLVMFGGIITAAVREKK